MLIAQVKYTERCKAGWFVVPAGDPSTHDHLRPTG